MSTPQAGILAAVPNLSRYLEFSSVPDTDLAAVVGSLASRKLAEDVVIGIGPSLVQGLKGSIELLRTFPSQSGPGCEVPSTQADIWCWIRGDDRGEIAHTGRSIAHQLQPAFRCSRLVDDFKYDGGRDLSGYEDGTENPRVNWRLPPLLPRALVPVSTVQVSSPSSNGCTISIISRDWRRTTATTSSGGGEATTRSWTMRRYPPTSNGRHRKFSIPKPSSSAGRCRGRMPAARD
jgi:deferrochelatase/peroxidase EfeB